MATIHEHGQSRGSRGRSFARHLDAIRAAIADSGLRDRVSLDERNVSWFLTIHGLQQPPQPSVVDLFETVARLAPGSYGILYTQDDEANLGTPEDRTRPASMTTGGTAA